ncbi:helix-turn-helix domain-containing protein [Marimonas sp. MJW-29]|uniref:Helix-turn-helix domain-containing protein n=1 Tax=Sulfitobacter sediminis TaxID=3234186 RepID=A0ABV3RM09_9RHOB
MDGDMDGNAFVKKLRQRIEGDPNLTPAGLAQLAGIDGSTIRKMLSIKGASPRIVTAEKICAALGTNFNDFMSDGPDPHHKEILQLYDQLTEEERRLILAAARGMLSQRHEQI